MLAERLKLFATLTSRFAPIAGVAVLLGTIATGLSVSAADTAPKERPRLAVTQAALAKGLAAFKRGNYAAAVPELEKAAADKDFTAQFTLAQISADNDGPQTDHAKAYMLYQSIADEFADVDPDDDRRAPFVAKALTALAGYLQVGIREIGLNPDPDRAADYLHHAALFFGDEDAQFELVKMKLSGEGQPEDIAGAKHWLAVLSQRGHAGAQAFLADLYWRGKFVEPDKVRAFALISVAVEHAPPRERIWIEDVYQNIFCGAGEGIRKQATGMVADWRARYGRRVQDAGPDDAAALAVHADRTCKNGDAVTFDLAGQQQASAPEAAGGSVGPSPAPLVTGSAASAAIRAQVTPAAGAPALGSLREAGSKTLEPLAVPSGIAQGLVSRGAGGQP